MYPFTLAHLIINIRFFRPSLSIFTKSWLVIIPVAIIATYVIWSFGELGEANFDYYYGVIFVSGSSVTIAFAILGARVFREGVLGVAWLLLVLGILATTIGDTWYYQLETVGEYDLKHAVNAFWYASYWIIVYALYKHRTII